MSVDLARSVWRKSSHSGGDEGNCVEVAQAVWRKSSHSGGNEGDCVEVAEASWLKSSHSGGDEGECVEIAEVGRLVAVRDSKNPDGAVLALVPSAWDSLLSHIKSGSYDRA